MKDDLSFFATISGTFAVVALVAAALIGEALPGSGIFAENAMLAKAGAADEQHLPGSSSRAGCRQTLIAANH